MNSFTKNIFTFLFFVTFCINASLLKSNSNSKIDSLEGLLKKPIQDTMRIFILNELSFDYMRINDFQKAFKNGKTASILSRKIGYLKGEAKGLINMGNVYLAKMDLPTAKKYYLTAYKIGKKINNRPVLADASNNLGEINRHLGNYDVALAYYIESFKQEEKMNYKPGIAVGLYQMGVIYGLQKNYVKAIESYGKSLTICKELNDDRVGSANLLNMADIYFAQDKIDEALVNYEQLLIVKQKSNNELEISICLLRIGTVYLKRDQLTEAMDYFMQALTLAENYENKELVSSCLTYIGLVYQKKGDYKKAIEYETKALELATILHLKPSIKTSYLNLARNYAKINDGKKAMEFFDAYIVLNDSLYNEQSSQQIAEMQTKYATEKKEKDNEALTQKNKLLNQKNKIKDLQINQNWYFIIGLSALAILIVVFSLLIIRQNKLNALYAKSEMEQKLLRSQMNPHFIFNAMVGIQNYIYKEEPEVAANYLSSVVSLMRAIIDNSKMEYVSLDKEIATLQHYLTLQQVRFPDKFKFSIYTNPSIEIENTLIPPMMAQPFIENAIVHGILNKTNGEGFISVNFSTEKNYLLLQIEDNGIGREKAKEYAKNDQSHLSIATNITNERLNLLNRKSKNKTSITIADLKDSNNHPIGTRTTFHFPLS